MHIQGPRNEGVSKGGHVSGLKSNRPVIGVPRVINRPTCRYSSQTAVSNNALISEYQIYGHLTGLWTFDGIMDI